MTFLPSTTTFITGDIWVGFAGLVSGGASMAARSPMGAEVGVAYVVAAAMGEEAAGIAGD